ncbi:alpha/beta fold hydrolase [Sphaerisporangium album]|uniref:Alpha/beta fold hydrolase n=1 Tax=Sphaerisporangium album TaxID=509200 RepID=A0A367F292_9ACTN|nr:non-ribosomal peptide synthetase [Sphaerisporangium album]RCG24494.1 alpha/beta fold hydrolase [Sphaerisporangium album]
MHSEKSFHSADVANLTELLLQAVHRRPASGVRYPTGSTPGDTEFQTYPELLAEAKCVLNGLRGRGLRPVTRVLLTLDRPADFIKAFWGCVLGGFVPCPVAPMRADPQRWAAHLEYLTGLLDAPLLVTTKDMADEVPEVTGLPVAQLEDLAGAVPADDLHRAESDALALLMLTSGSTGNAKAVMLTHANLLASMAAKAERLEVTEDDRPLNWINFDHIAAFEAHLLPMRAGATQSHVPPQAVLGDPLNFLRLIDAHRISLTFTPNFLLGQILKELPRAAGLTLDLSCLRHIISGGEATVRATATAFIDALGPHGMARTVLKPAFGMTETCAGSIFSTRFPQVDAGREFASLGHPVTGLRMRVADGDVAVPEGETGELQVRGPMVFGGYLNNEAATRAAFTADGWFRTGDLGTITEDGLALNGRSKDSIIVNGVNYFSHDIESVIERLDGVEKSYVAAFPSRAPGSDTEQLVIAFACAFPVTDEDRLHRLLTAIRNSVVLHWGFRPGLILPLTKADLPKTSLGKIERSRLRARLQAGEFAGIEAGLAEMTERQLGGYTAPRTEAERDLVEIYADLFGLDPRTIGATVSFFDLGGTSLDILRLKHRVEERFGVRDVPVIWLLREPTAAGLAARLDSPRPSGDADYEPLVPLQLTGSKTPLFCVHPGVGEVLVFVNLAKYLVNERPFYALRARGFGEGETHFTSFGEMVDTYVAAITARQPHGPYAIAGYSYGGAVAFEIAKVLEARGERVDFVGIFNLPPYIRSRMNELDFTEGAVNLAFFLELVTKQQAPQVVALLRASGMTERQQLQHLIDLAPRHRLVELDLDLEKFAAWVAIAQSMVMLGRDYEPSPGVESVTVFYAIPLKGTKEDWLYHQLRRWDDFTRGPNRYIDVPGEHYTLMGPKHVVSFQEILRQELDRALGGN